ncbi:MAG TPA: FlgD immunoglobulin-like domain containing protein [Gaiellaceae bacterium]|nr:FlgD immunoglobulin-like domain containing protein [Gaiellaceae bacterium]
MQRVLTTATLVGLLVATAAAFAITERLKLVKSPITGTHISAVFSPTCGCARKRANISVKFRHRDVVTVSILDSKLKPLRTLVAGQSVPRGRSVFRWEGLTDFGDKAPEGTYRVEIHLERQHRTILFPDRIRLDTTAPQVDDAHPNRLQFSPDGDQRADSVSINYVLSERAHALVYVNGQQVIRSRFDPTKGAVLWSGRVDKMLLPPGVVTLEVGAVDIAGNITPAADRARVRLEIRYITLANHHIVGVRAGKVFEIGVSTDAKLYAWRLGARHGVKAGPLLRLLAPQQKGRYTLTVRELGHVDSATVLVK